MMMSDEWEHINQALSSAAQGKTLRIASKKTLFGIVSSVDEAIEALAVEASRAAGKLPCDDRKTALLRASVRARAAGLGEHAVAGCAMRYFIWRGRCLGYDIPAYPYDSAGELREFLDDAGAESLPAWYARQGADKAQRAHLDRVVAVAARDGKGQWHAVFVDGICWVDHKRFIPLAQCDLLVYCTCQTLEVIRDLLKTAC